MASPTIIKKYRTIGEDVAFKMVGVPRSRGGMSCGQTVFFETSTGHCFNVERLAIRPSDRLYVKSILCTNPSDGRKSRTDRVWKVYATSGWQEKQSSILGIAASFFERKKDSQ